MRICNPLNIKGKGDYKSPDKAVEHFLTADCKSAETPNGGNILAEHYISMKRLMAVIRLAEHCISVPTDIHPLGVPPDLKSGVKKRPNLFILRICNPLNIKGKGDYKSPVIVVEHFLTADCKSAETPNDGYPLDVTWLSTSGFRHQSTSEEKAMLILPLTGKLLPQCRQVFALVGAKVRPNEGEKRYVLVLLQQRISILSKSPFTLHLWG